MRPARLLPCCRTTRRKTCAPPRSGFPSGSSCGQAGLGPEDDLAVGVAAFELGVGLADLRQRVDVRDRHLEVSVGDQAGQRGEHLGARPGRCPPVNLHPVLRGGREIDDGVDPLGRDAEGEGQLDVPVTVGVDEGVHAAGRGGPDPVRNAVTVCDRDHTVALQPLVVALARQADDRGLWTASEPTPPAAPEMTTVSPSLGWTSWTVPHAVAPATNRPPATSHETFSGLGVRSPASTRTSSAWEARSFVNPITSSPGENPPAPAPTSSTNPARSLPCPDGNVEGNSFATAPVRMTASLGLM